MKIKNPKLSPESLWLLCHLNELHPGGVGTVSPLPIPPHLKREVKMRHVRGLMKRGWVSEPYNGIFYITPEAKKP
jgi:hypothetical protein